MTAAQRKIEAVFMMGLSGSSYRERPSVQMTIQATSMAIFNRHDKAAPNVLTKFTSPVFLTRGGLTYPHFIL